jgi:hypothetical protein
VGECGSAGVGECGSAGKPTYSKNTGSAVHELHELARKIGYNLFLIIRENLWNSWTSLKKCVSSAGVGAGNTYMSQFQK